MKRWWRDYDDGFDELALHEDEDIVLPFIRKGRDVGRRKRLRAAAPKREIIHRDKIDDETQRQRIARVKAWGLPY